MVTVLKVPERRFQDRSRTETPKLQPGSLMTPYTCTIPTMQTSPVQISTKLSSTGEATVQHQKHPQPPESFSSTGVGSFREPLSQVLPTSSTQTKRSQTHPLDRPKMFKDSNHASTSDTVTWPRTFKALTKPGSYYDTGL